MKDNIAARTAVTVLLLFLIVALLTSCADNVKRIDRDRFMLVEEYLDCLVYVDLQTGVEWIERHGSMAPAVNSYGQPLIWPAFDAREDRIDADR